MHAGQYAVIGTPKRALNECVLPETAVALQVHSPSARRWPLASLIVTLPFGAVACGVVTQPNEIPSAKRDAIAVVAAPAPSKVQLHISVAPPAQQVWVTVSSPPMNIACCEPVDAHSGLPSRIAVVAAGAEDGVSLVGAAFVEAPVDVERCFARSVR